MNKIYLLFILYVFNSACSAPNGLSSKSSECVGSECIVAQAKFKATVGIVKQSQVMPALSTCLNLPDVNVSQGTKTRMLELKKLFSKSGKVTDISSPMLMAQIELAGDICSDLISYENSTKKYFFEGFGLGNSTSKSVNLDETIKKFSVACWGRAAFASETQKIKDGLLNANEKIFNDNFNSAAALFICATMLSAPDVISY